MLSANFIPNHSLFKHLRHTGLKSSSGFDVSSATEHGSCGSDAGARCALSGLTSAHSFNNSLHSESEVHVLLNVCFCSKGHPVTQTTGSSFYSVLLAPQKGMFCFCLCGSACHFPWIPREANHFVLIFFLIFPVFHCIGEIYFRPFLRHGHFYFKSSRIQSPWAINPI